MAQPRALLQGSAPEAVLPDLFKLPTCSVYGSHNTTWMRSAPHVRLGLPAFGPLGLTPGEFHPLASSYLEPLIVLAIPGMLIWMLLGLTLLCFCYRRYHLGLCGEPFPTVKEYTPKQMGANRLLTAATFAALLLLASQAMLVVNLTVDTAFDAFIEATSEIEELIRTSFGVGRQLLDSALDILTELDAFDAFIGQFVNTSAMLDTLRCTGPMLDSLPSGSTVLQVSDALRAAIEGMPIMSSNLTGVASTEAAFALLAHPLAVLPLQLPPLTAALRNLHTQTGLLPDLRLLASQLDDLNGSAVNSSGAATEIVRSLDGFNDTAYALRGSAGPQLPLAYPELPLLLNRMGRVYHSQSTAHICASIPAGWRPGDLTECDLLRAQLALTSEARATHRFHPATTHGPPRLRLASPSPRPRLACATGTGARIRDPLFALHHPERRCSRPPRPRPPSGSCSPSRPSWWATRRCSS